MLARASTASEDMLIFVFARVSYGLLQAILAEFTAVPNAQSVENSTAKTPVDVRTSSQVATPVSPPPTAERVVEHGGPQGPEPTRFGDWERNGRCVDF